MSYGIDFDGQSAIDSLQSLVTFGGIATLLGLVIVASLGRSLVQVIADLLTRGGAQ